MANIPDFCLLKFPLPEFNWRDNCLEVKNLRMPNVLRRKSPIINNMVLFFHNDCVDTHLVIKQRFVLGCSRILALNGSQLQMRRKFTTVYSAVSRSTEIKPFEDGLIHMCRYHLYLNRKFFGFNMPSRSCRACINVADSVSDGKITINIIVNIK